MDPRIVAAAKANMTRLSQNTYYGQLMFSGKSQDGEHVVQGFSIGGRRNYIFKIDDGRVYTRPADAEKETGTDDDLLKYNAMDERLSGYVFGNGSQTDNVFEAIGDFSSVTLNEALRNLTYVPDDNNTSRITGMCNLNGGCRVELSILQKSPFLMGEDDCERSYFEYQDIAPGIAFLISTYDGFGTPPLSFSGKPYPVLIKGDIDMVLDTYWHLLNKDNKVSLAVKFINIRSGQSTVKVVNRYTQVGA